MIAERVLARTRPLFDSLTSTTRRVWLTSFLLVALLTGLWVVADPLYAGPDEPAHVIRAVAVDHGQLTGEKLSRRLRRELRGERQDFLMVRVPAVYGIASSYTCFAFKPEVTAECLRFTGSTRERDDATYVARHPPAYYAFVGIASWVGRPGSGTVYLMRFLSALLASALVATAITAITLARAPRVIALGLAFALTPMVLFVTSVVNPSALEISAAIAVWTGGLVLVSRADVRIDKWLVAGVGLGGCGMALSRQLGPLWLGLIALTLLGVATRPAVRNLLRSNWARVWGLLIIASCLAQLAWNARYPLDVSAEGRPPMHEGTSQVIRIVTGRYFSRYHEMIGLFGWGDSPTPALTWIPWTAGIVFLLFAAALWVTRRHLLVLLALVAAVIVVPIIIESSTYNEGGGVNWQGRYTLPLAVGVPIFAAFALAATYRGRELVSSRFLLATGVLLGLAQLVAFAQNLRRYTVGYDGAFQFWQNPRWTPPGSPLLLTIAFGFAVSGFLVWLLVAVPGAGKRSEPSLDHPAREQLASA